jgi:hypothetical protein
MSSTPVAWRDLLILQCLVPFWLARGKCQLLLFRNSTALPSCRYHTQPNLPVSGQERDVPTPKDKPRTKQGRCFVSDLGHSAVGVAGFDSPQEQGCGGSVNGASPLGCCVWFAVVCFKYWSLKLWAFWKPSCGMYFTSEGGHIGPN